MRIKHELLTLKNDEGIEYKALYIPNLIAIINAVIKQHDDIHKINGIVEDIIADVLNVDYVKMDTLIVGTDDAEYEFMIKSIHQSRYVLANKVLIFNN